MSSRIRLFSVVIAFAVTAAAPPPATPSHDAFDEARRAFERGLAHLDAGDHDAAIADFTASLDQRFSLPAQYNLGLAFRAAHRSRDAVAAFEAFLDVATAKGHTDGVEHARTLVAALRADLARVALRIPADVSNVTLDGAPLDEGEGEHGLVLDPGVHVLAYVDARGEPRTQRSHLAPGSHVTIEIGGLPVITEAPPPVVPTPTVEETNTSWGWWVGGLVVAIAASAAVTYALTRPDEPDFDGGTRDVVLRGLTPRTALGGAQ